MGPSPSVGSIMSMTGSGVGTSVSDGVAFVGDIVGLFVGGGDVGILV